MLVWEGSHLGKSEWEPYTQGKAPVLIVHNQNVPVERQIIRIQFRDAQTQQFLYQGASNYYVDQGAGIKFRILESSANDFVAQIFLQSCQSLEYQFLLIREEPDPIIRMETGGSVDSAGFPVEYRFDWGDGSLSEWSSSSVGEHTYSRPGIYHVRAQSRAPGVESAWSDSKIVTVYADPIYVYTPSVPLGPSSLAPKHRGTFSISQDRVSDGSVRYRFNFGDGFITEWSDLPHASYTWKEPGIYQVRAQAAMFVSGSWKTSHWSDYLEVCVGPLPPPEEEIPSFLEEDSKEGEKTSKPSLSSRLVILHEMVTISLPPYTSRAAREVQYRIDFGDSLRSLWSSDPVTKHAWVAPGIYRVSGQIRYRDDPEAQWTELLWSDVVTIQVRSRMISTPMTPRGVSEVQSRMHGLRTESPAGELIDTRYDTKWIGDWEYVPGLGDFDVPHALGTEPYRAYVDFDFEGQGLDRYAEVRSEEVSDGSGQDVSVLLHHLSTPTLVRVRFHRYLESVRLSEHSKEVKRIVSRYRLILRG